MVDQLHRQWLWPVKRQSIVDTGLPGVAYTG